MTDEQGRILYKMDDQKLLCELAIAYGNTTDADLGCCHRKNIMAILADLNLDHINDYPCNVKERSGSYGKSLQDAESEKESNSARD